MKQCEQCGAAIVDGMAFCTNCGAPVSNAGAGAPTSAGGGVPGAGVPGASPAAGPAAAMGASMGTPTGALTGVPASAPAQNPANPMAMGTGAALKDIHDRPKNNKPLIISLAAACVVCLVVGIVGIVMAATSGGNSDKNDSDRVAVNIENNGSTVDTTASGTKVQYKGYEFTIPDGYEYDVAAGSDGNEYLFVTDDANAWMASIGYFEDATFAQIQSNIGALADYAVEGGYATTTTSGETEVDGVEFVYIDMMGVNGVEGRDLTYAYAKAGLYYFEIEVANIDYDIDHSYLDKVAPVVASAKQKKSLDRAMGGETGSFDNVGVPGGALVQGANLTVAEE